ncbi:MAG: response regulator [Deltaproteobacteria bacterium]|nr:response regulator [Deltaproteobacteria bacterium]MDL1962047.1 response regulator [Deltaproteobacteria bacterium]
MKDVLIVDDEKGFLLSLSDGLKSYSDEFKVLIAFNGKEAIKILNSTKIDLVVTDLKMPEMDGFQLLAYLTRHFSDIPTIVMTAFGTPDMEAKLLTMGASQYLEKPLDFDILADNIRQHVARHNSEGHIKGIALGTFLQFLEMEEKTCTLTVTSNERIGSLYFLEGELINAKTKISEGEQAAYEIIGWDETEIEINYSCENKTKTITSPLTFILMESCKIKDEASKQLEDQEIKDIEEKGIDKIEEIDFLVDKKEDEIKQDYIEEEYEEHLVSQPEIESISSDSGIITAPEKLEPFKSIIDFAGVGILTPTGEPLVMLPTGELNLMETAILANNILVNAQKASQEMGIGNCKMIHIETDRIHILARCLNEGKDPFKVNPGKAHIHLVLVLSSEAGIGLAKLKMASVIKSLADDFRI